MQAARYSQDLLDKAGKIKLLVLDVDGVLSDGGLYYGNQGEELKRFNILDGLGIKLLQQAGISTAIITGRQSVIVSRRAEELGISHYLQGREDKITALNELLDTVSVSLLETAYVGDDLPDLAAIKAAGLGITVPNGYIGIKPHADWQTSAGGGHGAVREVSDLLLYAQGKLDATIERYHT